MSTSLNYDIELDEIRLEDENENQRENNDTFRRSLNKVQEISRDVDTRIIDTGKTITELTATVETLTTNLNSLTAIVNALVLDDLNDVDTVSTPPVLGDRLEFNGTNWVPV